MQSFVNRLGLVLSIAAFGLALVVHVATFLTIVPVLWLLSAFFPLAGCGLCAQANGLVRRFEKPAGVFGWLCFLSLIYAALMFFQCFRTVGWATSVDIVNGEYVYKYKAQILRTITEQEYKMFPTLWIRPMSALTAAGALSFLKHFTSKRTAAAPSGIS